LDELYLFPYHVIATDYYSGLIECVPAVKSRSSIGAEMKKINERHTSLYDYFLYKFGHEKSESFKIAQYNFIMSLVPYSLATFILQIKDRHNENILIDDVGHIIHIDFGFMLEIAPGGKVSLESAPFKLTKEMILIMGGPKSEAFEYFTNLCVKAFLALRQHMESIITVVELMIDTNLECFRPTTLNNLRARFAPEASQRGAATFIQEKISESYDRWGTWFYDYYQLYSNSIEF